MSKVKLKLKTCILLVCLTFLLPVGQCRDGEFVAGSFILTQKALSEAPYRYSRFLTDALKRMELVDPPSRRDEENCNVRYRIEPSGRSWETEYYQSGQNKFAEDLLLINMYS